MRLVLPLVRPFMKTRAAATPIHLASSPEVAGVSGAYFANQRAKQSSKASYDRDLAHRLWEVSSALVGIDQNPNPPSTRRSRHEARRAPGEVQLPPAGRSGVRRPRPGGDRQGGRAPRAGQRVAPEHYFQLDFLSNADERCSRERRSRRLVGGAAHACQARAVRSISGRLQVGGEERRCARTSAVLRTLAPMQTARSAASEVPAVDLRCRSV